MSSLARRHLIVSVLLVLLAARLAPPARSVVPDSLTDEQFWKLSAQLSEPGGAFRSDNLLSNERRMQHVIPSLVRSVPPGTAYLGVGPEQNFTYIAALRPAMAFIVDIRRANLQLHLMYKALFELSGSRAEFVSRLFSRRPRQAVDASAGPADIFAAHAESEPEAALFERNLAAVRERLTKARGLPLGADDLQGIEGIYRAFFAEGPLITYRAHFGGNIGFPTYVELMTATDASGVPRSYLSSDEAFAFVKDLHAKNLIVPVVGDFAGPAALRRLGSYLREKHAAVGVFYLSNVEQYLGREGRWQTFCENVATLPLAESSTFIRAVRDLSVFTRGMNLNSTTGSMLGETRYCVR
jgi:hypothetical protein